MSQPSILKITRSTLRGHDTSLLDDLHKCQANLIIHCFQLDHLDG
ncbi:MAG TPA: hypothetical protein VFC05_15905 [Nitrososphaeraceae archaeon]|nr:hypothetical protein [Nitrososphaeraceae archaeon]